MMKKKPIKLSFEDDEENEENEDEAFAKSSKGANNRMGGRRIKQAEVKILVAEETKPLVSSGNYDVNSLKELKLQQKFTSEDKIIAKPDEMVVDEIILNGEDAEALEKQQENPEELTKEEKLLIKHAEERSKKNNSRLFMSFNDDDSRKNIDMTQDLDKDWEREIMRRGGLGVNEEIFEVVGKSVADNFSNELSDVIQLVSTTYMKLEQLVQKDAREKEQLKSELEICEKEIEAIQKEKTAFLEEHGKTLSNQLDGDNSEAKMIVDE